MKKIAALVLYIFCLCQAQAQHIVWEKVFGPNGPDKLGCITMAEDSNMLCVGTSVFHGGAVVFPSSDAAIGMALVKLNKYGDTIYIKRLQLFTQSGSANNTPYVGHKFNNVYQAVVNAAVPFGTSFRLCPTVVEFTTEGEILNTHILFDLHNWRASTALATEDNGLLIGGTFSVDPFTPIRMFSIKVNFLGEVEWARKWEPPAPIQGNAYRMFNTKKNEYLITGTMGRRIAGFTFDSAGNQLSTKVFYETPSMIFFNRGEATIGPEKSIIAAGQYSGTNIDPMGYFGKFDSLGNKIWGGESIGSASSPIANHDGTIWLLDGDLTTQMISLKKFDSDSTLITTIPLNPVGALAKRWQQYLPIGNNQVIAVGYQRLSSNLREQFLVTKIDSFGVPITSTAGELKHEPPAAYSKVVCYPNPATATLSFKGIEQAATVQIYSAMGKQLHSSRLEPGKALSIHTLPSGTYLYHLRMGERVFTGKFIKE